MTDRSNYLTLAHVSDEFGVSHEAVRRWVHSGQLRAIKIGKGFFIEPAEVERLRAAGGVGTPTPPPPPAAAPRAEWAAYIERVVTAAPPLSPEQAARITTLLGTARDRELATA
ncbi:helix-turn-helix domain-containing protein [Nocardia ignorata]|uniref:helix-turn-helix domain-containing protein n=1 Tax=Nocardia ignorata TaxID=145285 RepID=UPI003644F7AD